MRFIHTSDWHLGRLFHGAHLTDDQAHVLSQFVDLVKESRPEAILIAGDIYDRAVPPPEAVNLLDEVLSQIVGDLRIPTVIIAGNHDSPERLNFGSRLLTKQGLHVHGRLSPSFQPIVLEDGFGKVNVYPIAYAEPPVVREQLEDASIDSHNKANRAIVDSILKNQKAQARKILVTHAFVAGGQESESERPLSLGGSGLVDVASFAGFDYVALGHLHRPQKIGSESICYSGSLMKYSFSEADHKKSINIVEMDGEGKTRIEKVSLSPRRDVRILDGYLADILSQAENDAAKSDYLMVTLRDTGAIFDAIGKLRQVYPNVMHIERPLLNSDGRLANDNLDHRKVNEADLFANFYQQVTEENLTDEQWQAFRGAVSNLSGRAL
jgi:exonuclease SbcD